MGTPHEFFELVKHRDFETGNIKQNVRVEGNRRYGTSGRDE